MTSQNPPARFSRYPLFWLFLSLAAGILLADATGVGMMPFLLGAAAAGTGTAVSSGGRASRIIVLGMFVCLGGLALGLERDIPEHRLKRMYDSGSILSGSPVILEGRIVGNVEPSFDGFTAVLRVDKLTRSGSTSRASGDVRLRANVGSEEVARDYDRLDLRHGAVIRVACTPEREERFRNPGVRSNIQMLDAKGIDATATIKSPLLVTRVGRAEGFSLPGAIYGYRRELIGEVSRLFSVSTAGVLNASLLGDKYFLDRQTADVFREGGTFHVLVISGLHITFIGGMTLVILGLFTRRRGWQFAIAAAFLWTYTLAVGADVPVVRASIMFTVLLFSRVIYREGTLLNSLGLCGLILLAWRPEDVFNPSFQLTFASVAAIITCVFTLIESMRNIGSWTPTSTSPFPARVPAMLKRSCETLYWNEAAWAIERRRNVWSANLHKSPYFTLPRGVQRLTAYLIEGLLVSLIVQAWLLPLLVVYFHRVTPGAVVLNVWVGAVITIESIAAVAAVLLAQFSETLALPMIAMTEMFNSLLVSVPAVLTGHAGFRVPVFSGVAAIVYYIYYVPVIVLAAAVHRWKPFSLRAGGGIWRGSSIGAAGLLLIAAGVIVFHPFSSPRADGRLTVEFVDVGQGDAALVTFPDGETMLVDGGGRIDLGGEAEEFEPDVPRIGETVVSEFLWERGYSRIGRLAATHADADHADGLSDAAANFEIGEVLLPGDAVPELEAVMARKGIAGHRPTAGERAEIGGVTVEVLNPRQGMTGTPNDRSIVLKLTFGERSFLLAGDIEAAAEAGIAGEGLAADVVKVPHHGSRTSSTQAFVDAVGARIAVIPVGRRSMFGHPHAEVVQRWQASGAVVITTGERGTITISTDGKDLRVGTYVQ